MESQDKTRAQYEKEALEWFTRKMAENLSMTFHGWKDHPEPKVAVEYLRFRIAQEAIELYEIMYKLPLSDKEAVVQKCADIANLAMFIAFHPQHFLAEEK